MRRFDLDEEDAFARFLATTRRAVVFWRGEDCEYSEAFEPRFTELDAGAWSLAQRGVEHGAEGPVGDRYALELTPTLVAYRDGKEAARLEAALGIGIEPATAQAWLRGLP